MLQIDDWRADGIRWRNMGLKHFNNQKIQKRYYQLQLEKSTESGFRRYCFSLSGNSSLKLVQYTGDHTLVVPFAHKNSKSKSAFCMTLPSTLLYLQNAVQTKDAHRVYKEAINSTKSIQIFIISRFFLIIIDRKLFLLRSALLPQASPKR